MKVKKILGECLVKMGVEDFTAKQTLTQEETALEKKQRRIQGSRDAIRAARDGGGRRF